MANTNAPFGFTYRQGNGSAPTNEYANGFRHGAIDYNAGAIYYGDPVVRVTGPDGTIAQAAGAAGALTVTLAGIFYGCKYLSTSQKKIVWNNYWPGVDVASTAQSTIDAFVVNDPNAQFLVQSDSTGLAWNALGANFDFNIGSGTAANGLSGAYLLHTGATTAAYPFRLQDLLTDPPGAPGTSQGATVSTASPYVQAIVAFNNVETKNATAVNT